MTAAPIEWLFALIGLLCFAKTAHEAVQVGYLPFPMIPDPHDFYGDGYNTTWWGMNGHMYDAWQTVYPPLSFVIVRLTAWSRCYAGDTMYVRDCDWGFWSAWMAVFALNAIVIARIFWRRDPLTAVPRTFAVVAGLPMLYLVERLNLLLLGFTGIILLVATGVRSAWLRSLGMAVAINLKPYLLSLLFGFFLQRRWRALEMALVLTVLLWFVSYAVIGSGSPLEVYENIAKFSVDPDRAASWASITYAASYNPMIQFLQSRFPLMPRLGSFPLEFWPALLGGLIRLVQATSAVGFFAAWLHPRAVTRTRLLTLCYLLTECSVEPGGYSMVIALFLVLLERRTGAERKIAVTCAYLLSLVIAVKWLPLGQRVVFSYLAGHDVFQQDWVTLDPFVRPALMMVMLVALTVRTVRDVLAWRQREGLPPLLARSAFSFPA